MSTVGGNPYTQQNASSDLARKILYTDELDLPERRLFYEWPPVYHLSW